MVSPHPSSPAGLTGSSAHGGSCVATRQAARDGVTAVTSTAHAVFPPARGRARAGRPQPSRPPRQRFGGGNLSSKRRQYMYPGFGSELPGTRR